jgi:hypothetical protein
MVFRPTIYPPKRGQPCCLLNHHEVIMNAALLDEGTLVLLNLGANLKAKTFATNLAKIWMRLIGW